MCSNLTAKEYFKLHGTLTPERIEALLDNEESLEAITGVDAYIQEAMGQFPPEDFLHDIKTRLFELTKRIRGANKSDLSAIIESMDDALQCQFNSSDYGRSELRSARKAIAATTN